MVYILQTTIQYIFFEEYFWIFKGPNNDQSTLIQVVFLCLVTAKLNMSSLSKNEKTEATLEFLKNLITSPVWLDGMK